VRAAAAKGVASGVVVKVVAMVEAVRVEEMAAAATEGVRVVV
jgi:hypothetical protein